MTRNDSLYSTLIDKRLIPVIKITDADNSEALADALVTGGLSVAEVTFRTSCASEVIARMKHSRPGMFVGAGTVLSVSQVDDAVHAGADFIVAPGFDRAVVERSLELGVPVVPGCVTPSEISAALSMGLSTVKFFPASSFGGAATIKALSAPFPGLNFIPTGGIDMHNLREYTSMECVLAVGGSFMATEKLIEAQAWDEIAARTRAAITEAANTNRT